VFFALKSSIKEREIAMHQPFLKSVQPINLLSFGPETEPIELKALNILIGPNGSGKSNFIEVLGLLKDLPDKDPWSTVIETGGATEWIWKGTNRGDDTTSLFVRAAGQRLPPRADVTSNDFKDWLEKPDRYLLVLQDREGTFEVLSESFGQPDSKSENVVSTPWINRNGWHGVIHALKNGMDAEGQFSNLSPRVSILSLLGTESRIAFNVPHIRDFAENLQNMALYRDWTFGVDAAPRDPQPAGLDSSQLDEDTRNLAQVLKAWRDRGDQASFRRLVELMSKFYQPITDVDAELLGTHLRIMIKEEGLRSRTTAARLSDGTLRWLTLLTILLQPTPPPVICLEEPELGLHPDIIPTLADLLREASERSQLILTTHSSILVDAFSDQPDAICVCEKVEGSTVIRRLSQEDLAVWLKEYSLGSLWTSGQIGGNRW
jgi:predicted ATPase